jgi:hypothetical protein
MGSTSFQIMFRSLKLVGVLLVLVILSAPLLAAVTCFNGAPPAAMPSHCPAGCAMMAASNMAPVAQLAAQHFGGPCCNISSDRPSPAAVVQQRIVPASAVQTISPATPGFAPAIVRARSEQSKAVRFPDSPQSLLCVFLI